MKGFWSLMGLVTALSLTAIVVTRYGWGTPLLQLVLNLAAGMMIIVASLLVTYIVFVQTEGRRTYHRPISRLPMPRRSSGANRRVA